jgi:YD repeat-containing protein
MPINAMLDSRREIPFRFSADARCSNLLHRVLARGLITILLAVALCPTVWATTYYTYDALGRVTQAIESDGTTTQYSYDANGNVTSIARAAGTSVLTVSSVSATSGAVGSSITINGSGFSSIGSQDSVTFNGLAGTVTYASGNRLVVTVPSGATTGSLAVTSPNGSITAAPSFSVVPVAISSFSPSTAVAGTSISVVGGGFDPTASNDSVTVNGVVATVTSASTTQLQITVPAGATAGHIAVTTTQGSAVSSGYLVVPSASYSLANIAIIGSLTPGGAGRIYPINSTSQVGLAMFDGTAGQLMTLTLTNVDMAGEYQIFAPNGSQIASGSISNNALIYLPALPANGTYSFYLAPTYTVGSANVRLLSALTGTLPTDGTPTPTALASGQYAALTFSGTAGQSYSLALTNYQTSAYNSQVNIYIVSPGGSLLANCGAYLSLATPPGNCDFTIPTSGTYTVQINPYAGLYTSSFNVLLNQDFTASLTAGTPGPAVGLSLVAGQHGLVHFTATAGQTLALYIGSVTVTPANSSVTVAVTGPTGAAISTSAIGIGGSTTFNLTNLAAGTYSALITPNNAAGGPASMQAQLANGVTPSLAANGTTSSIQTWLAGQAAFPSFPGTSGQTYSFGQTQLNFVPSSVNWAWSGITNPDGTSLTSMTCYSTSSPGCEVGLGTVSQTGNYGIAIYPSGQATMSFGATVSQDVTGTLTLSTPVNISLTTPGQTALMSFAVTAGQSVVLNIGSLATSPTNTAVIFYVYNSSGALVTQTSLSANGAINLGTLAAGTYKVVVAPNNAATASLNLTLAPAASGALTLGVPAQFGTSSAGQNITLTFAATTGQSVSVALSNVTLTPVGASSMTVNVYKPDGSLYFNWTNTVGASGWGIPMYSVPQTGTYSMVVSPGSSSQTMSYTATYSTAAANALQLNTPATANLNTAGQSGLFTFTTTAGQTVALNIGGITTSPAGATLYINVYRSNGTQLTTTTTVTGTTLNLANLAADTYSVLVFPEVAATTTLQVTEDSGSTGTILNDGSSTNFNTSAPGQIAYVNFNATAGQNFTGQNVALALTNLVLTPSSAGNYVIVAMYEPNGSYYYQWNCYVGSGCEYGYANLPVSGTWSLQIKPASASQTMSFTTTLSTDLTGTLALNTPTSLNLSQLGQLATLTFSATAGQTVALNASGITSTPANTTYTVVVYNPSGTQVASASTTTGTTINLHNLVSGSYTVYIYPNTPATGTMQVTVDGGVTQSVAGDGSGTNFTTVAPGQAAYVNFTATAGQGLTGQNLTLALTNLVLTPSAASNYVIITMYEPNGSYYYQWTCYVGAGCEYGYFNFPVSGTWYLQITPGSPTQTMSFTTNLTTDLTGTLALNTPTSLNLSQLGQVATLSFSATAGQTVALNASTITSTPANTTYTFVVYNPSGTQIASASTTTGTTINLHNLVAGSYTVFIYPNTPATGTMQVTVDAGVAQSVAGDGSATNFTTVAPGQAAYVNFTATAGQGLTGQNITLALTNLVLTPSAASNYVIIGMYEPNGSYYYQWTCYVASSCEYGYFNFPVSGTWYLQITPGSPTQTMSFTTNLTTDLTGTLAHNTPTPLSLGEMGQVAMLTFTATAGQTLAIAVTGISSTPANTPYYFVVYNPSGTAIASTSSTTGTTINLANLAAGNYNLFIYPSPSATATMQLNLTP